MNSSVAVEIPAETNYPSVLVRKRSASPKWLRRLLAFVLGLNFASAAWYAYMTSGTVSQREASLATPALRRNFEKEIVFLMPFQDLITSVRQLTPSNRSNFDTIINRLRTQLEAFGIEDAAFLRPEQFEANDRGFVYHPPTLQDRTRYRAISRSR